MGAGLLQPEVQRPVIHKPADSVGTVPDGIANGVAGLWDKLAGAATKHNGEPHTAPSTAADATAARFTES